MKNYVSDWFFQPFVWYRVLLSATVANAAPVAFNQVLQNYQCQTGKSKYRRLAQLRLADQNFIFAATMMIKRLRREPQDDRVIVETRAEIVEDDVAIVRYRRFQ